MNRSSMSLLLLSLLAVSRYCTADGGETYRSHRIHQPRLLNYTQGMVIRNGGTLTIEDSDPEMRHGSVGALIGGRRVGSGGDLDYATLSGYVTEIKLNLIAVNPGRHTLIIYNRRGNKVFYAVHVER